MINLKNIYSTLYASFKVNKISEPKTSAQVILNKALHRPINSIGKVSPTPISLFHYNKIKKMALRRLRHEPIEYITQNLRFRNLMFEVERPVTIPDKNTEELIDIVHQLVPEKEERVHILDVETGCGACILSLLKEKPNSIGVAIDSSGTALELAERNFFRTFGKDAKMDGRLDLVQSDFKDFVKHNVHKFDVVIASPPCTPSAECEKLAKEIKLYENRKAIDGGTYGLDKIWELLRKTSDCLKKGGFLIIKMDEGQPEYFEDYFRENGDTVHQLKILDVKIDSSWKKTFMVLQKQASPSSKVMMSEMQSKFSKAV